MNKKGMNDFLQFWKQIAIENPHLDFSDYNFAKKIYHELIRLGVKKEDKDKNVESMFNHWITYFKDKENISAFVDPYWSYFCQFINSKNQESTNHIKLYIPTDYNHLKESANLIFDFLAKNNIPHISKIGKEIRFDNIVIRLTNIEDVPKIIDFVKNNSYIQEGLIEPNPFAFTKDNIAIVSDGNLSYNTVISDYIRLYLHFMKSTKQLHNINADSFINFIQNYYQDKFINKNNIKEVLTSFHHMDNKPAKDIVNLKQVTELIIKSYSNTFTFEDYINYFNEITDKKLLTIQELEYNDALQKKENSVTQINPNKQIINELEITKLLLETLKVMSNKYSKEIAINAIVGLINTNDYSYITRDNHLRIKLKSCNFREQIMSILQKKDITIQQYINNIVSSNQKKEQKSDIDELLREYIIIMSNKYGKKNAFDNLRMYFTTNNSTLITRDNDLRNRITSINFKEQVLAFLEENDLTLSEYFNSVLDDYTNNNQNRR